MAIKKTTAVKKTTVVKKSDPPKKGFNPTRSIGTKTFGKILKPGQKSDVYYYEEGGQGMGGIKMSKPSLSYASTPNIGKMVSTQRVVKKKK